VVQGTVIYVPPDLLQAAQEAAMAPEPKTSQEITAKIFAVRLPQDATVMAKAKNLGFAVVVDHDLPGSARRAVAKLEDVARAIAAAPRVAGRTNKFRDDGCVYELVRVADDGSDPVLLEAFRDYDAAFGRQQQIAMELLARAALEALREPSEAMIGAAYAVGADGEGPHDHPAFSDMWRAAIDVLLADA